MTASSLTRYGSRILFVIGLTSLTAGVALILTGCGGGSGAEEEPLSVDYSGLRVAESRAMPLQYARSSDEILRPLRNGIRLMTAGATPAPVAGIAFNSDVASRTFSNTTVQINGVDEADSVKYDGRHIFSVRPEAVPPSPASPQWSRNVLNIARTNPANATVQPVSKFVIEGEQSGIPLLYQLSAADGSAEQIVAISQDFRGWMSDQPLITALVIQPDRTTIQLLDVRDPQHVMQTWKLEMDGWMRASRMIGDTLYIVNSYRPRLPDLIYPADTLEKREANERSIRSASTALMPQYRENGGTPRQLAVYDGCLIAQGAASTEAYTDLLVISAINLRTRRVTDVNCLSTNVNSVYMSRNSLYIAGRGSSDSEPGTQTTVLHKFAVRDGDVSYRATGVVSGTLGWSNPSYFMDEHEGDLRILTSTSNTVHRLTVLRESGQNLMLVSSIPNTQRPAPIGKPGEQVQAVRFMGKRAYVVTFRSIDPLYVIDLQDPSNPAIAGELEIPGFSTHLQPLGPTRSEYLLTVGQEVDASTTRREGIKVELFDVRDIAQPKSLGSQVFGEAGSQSEALNNPHALAFLEKTTPTASLRLAIPVQVHDTPRDSDPNAFDWTYTGLHLLEVAGVDTAAPELRLQGVIKTDQRSPSKPYPHYATPERGVLHGDAVFAIHDDQYESGLWPALPPG